MSAIRAWSITLALSLVGCSTTPRLDSQWVDPHTRPVMLRGAKVLVACDASDPLMRRVCQEQMAAQVTAHGGVPVFAADATTPGQSSADAQYLPAARAAGASAVLATTVGAGDRHVSPGMSVGIGGWGIGSGRVRGGVGVSMPIGGGSVSQGYSANGRVTDAASGKLLWMATASSAPSGDFGSQMAELAKKMVDAARGAGFF